MLGNQQGLPRVPYTVGITNLGNTCYISSVVQCMAYALEVGQAVGHGVNTLSGAEAKGSALAWLQLIRLLITHTTPIDATQFISWMVKRANNSIAPTLVPAHQGDAHEFLVFLISKFIREYQNQ